MGSSVLAAGLTQVANGLRDWVTKGRSAKFSALYLALALESYGDECSTLISDSETYDGSGGHAGSPRGRLPELAPYPDEIDWTALGLPLTTEALSFRVSIGNSNARIAGVFEFQDPDDGAEATRMEAANLGVLAFTIARRLRRDHKVVPLAMDEHWNPDMHLRERQIEYIERRRVAAADNAAMWAEIEQAPAAEQPEARICQ